MGSWRAWAAIAVAGLALSGGGAFALAQDASDAPAAEPPIGAMPAARPYPYARPATTAATAIHRSLQAARPTAPPSQARAAAKPAPVTAPLAPAPPQTAAAAAAAPPPAPGARLQPGAPIPAGELEAFIDGVVREGMQRDHIPGVSISVVQNGQVALNKAYGFASYEPRRAADANATLFRLGAISASFTWLAVMREVEHGHMRLDAPINIYLPEKLQVRDQGYAEPIHLRDLMDHASGFEDRAMGRLYERDPSRVRPLETYLRQERPRRVTTPGHHPEFTEYDAALAGEAVSQVTGQPFEDLIDAELLRPLNLAHTTFREPRDAIRGLPAPMSPTLAQSMAVGYRWTGLDLEPRPFAYAGQIAPAASASSDATDMGRVMLLLLGNGVLDGQTLFGAQTANGLKTVLLTGAPGVAGWTYGLKQQSLPAGVEGLGLEGPGLSFYADMTLAPSLNLGVFAAGDSETARLVLSRLPALIVEHFYAAPAAQPPAAGADPDALRQTYAGHYLSEARRYGGLEKFVDLMTHTMTVQARPDGRLVIRAPEGEGVWTPSGTDGRFVSFTTGATSAFDLKDGKAKRWYAPSGGQSFERVGFLMRPAGLAVFAALAVVASIATLIGLFVRDRRDFRQTGMQQRASALQTSASVLWLLAGAFLAIWSWGATRDAAQSFFDWPGGFILVASACALVAAVATVGQLLSLPSVWRGGRRLDSWTGGRKLTFTVTVLVFLAFSGILAAWGALEPWNS